MDLRLERGEPACTVFGRVAEFVLRSPQNFFPADVLKAASLQFLDTMGIAIAAGPMQAGRIARDAAVLLYGCGTDRHAARMIFDGRRVSIAGAAFAAATQTDNLDGHDGYPPTKGHIGVAVIPALLALAEEKPDLSGIEALAAIVVGYEVAGRAGIALHATVSDYHTSGAWNSLGVAAVAARLLRLNDTQLRDAFGIAEYHGPRSQMMREIATPTMLHDGSGMGAQVGLSAAVLAQAGFAGAPAITVEAPEVARYWADLGDFWQMPLQYVKPYPICRWAHAAIDATRALCLQHGLRPQDIGRINVNSFHYAATLFDGMPDTTSKAQYSLAFAVATMILYGRIAVEHISGQGLCDGAVGEMLGRVEVSESARHSARFPEGRWADVQIETTDGRLLDSGDVHARGGPEAPISEADIVAKYMEFSAPVLGEARAAAIRDAILGLTGTESRFSDLSALIYEPPGGLGGHAA
ncbi:MULTISPECIES: MmgE/PrpD family protein [unclassified Mesorhizobium]|uniref:MmgE/PrpD family protein n=1 Tax=unclassified Mesorhizobium TaxID=325217 RepID=UPI0011297793|nr:MULTISPECIES: MmgE/PrpD family protein [unclassified Mesorhizobium]MBZ9810236.1 MmgE/PrpD family protein [Mesorhizobium sp. ESP-6-2]TPM29456.1 MmgE/PrpD family protein [Mesorhizobium sp. B2-2-2]